MAGTDRTNTARAPVIWVGDAGGETFDRLAAVLQRCGVSLEIARSSEQLRRAVERSPRAVVVVLDDASGLGVNAPLEVLESFCRPVTVVALTERPEFGRYYDLMGRGVEYYYGFNEGPDCIARAVRHTAARAA